jgi:predicted PurR-regulated permease PerM
MRFLPRSSARTRPEFPTYRLYGVPAARVRLGERLTMVIETAEQRSPGIEQRAPNYVSYALFVIAAGVLLALLYFGRPVFITAITAIIIALMLEPFVGLLVKLRLPRAVSAFVVCLVASLVLYFAGLAAWNQIVGLAGDAPVFRERFSVLINGISDRIQAAEDSAGRFILPEKVAAPPVVNRGTKRAKRDATPPPLLAAPGTIPEVRIHQDSRPIADFVFPRLRTVYDFVLMASFVPFLVYFMLSWRDHIYRTFLRFFEGDAERMAAERSLGGVAAMARAFVVGNFLIGILLTALSWAGFALIRLPYPFLVGVLSGFLSLIPYVGMPVALAPPVLASIAGGVPTTILLIASLIVLGLHLAAMNVLYPKLVGSRVHLNPLIVTFSLMFWGFLWDAPGLILAIPITAGLKAVCDNVPGLRAWGKFLGD